MFGNVEYKRKLKDIAQYSGAGLAWRGPANR